VREGGLLSAGRKGVSFLNSLQTSMGRGESLSSLTGKGRTGASLSSLRRKEKGTQSRGRSGDLDERSFRHQFNSGSHLHWGQTK